MSNSYQRIPSRNAPANSPTVPFPKSGYGNRGPLPANSDVYCRPLTSSGTPRTYIAPHLYGTGALPSPIQQLPTSLSYTSLSRSPSPSRPGTSFYPSPGSTPEPGRPRLPSQGSGAGVLLYSNRPRSPSMSGRRVSPPSSLNPSQPYGNLLPSPMFNRPGTPLPYASRPRAQSASSTYTGHSSNSSFPLQDSQTRSPREYGGSHPASTRSTPGGQGAPVPLRIKTPFVDTSARPRGFPPPVTSNTRLRSNSSSSSGPTSGNESSNRRVRSNSSPSPSYNSGYIHSATASRTPVLTASRQRTPLPPAGPCIPSGSSSQPPLAYRTVPAHLRAARATDPPVVINNDMAERFARILAKDGFLRQITILQFVEQARLKNQALTHDNILAWLEKYFVYKRVSVDGQLGWSNVWRSITYDISNEKIRPSRLASPGLAQFFNYSQRHELEPFRCKLLGKEGFDCQRAGRFKFETPGQLLHWLERNFVMWFRTFNGKEYTYKLSRDWGGFRDRSGQAAELVTPDRIEFVPIDPGEDEFLSFAMKKAFIEGQQQWRRNDPAPYHPKTTFHARRRCNSDPTFYEGTRLG